MRANTGISLIVLLFALAGVAISAYLTSVHYSDVPLACSSAGAVNCEKVLTSSYASVAGIPWSAGGIVWFGVTGILAAATLLRRPEPELLQPAQVVWSFIGLLTAVYLIGVEMLKVDKICLWCSALHGLIMLILVLNLIRNPFSDEESLSPGLQEA